MPPRRPAPLSEELFQPAASSGGVAVARPVVAAPAPGAATLLGATNNGVPLPVKNTFIDVPSGLTPSGMKSATGRSVVCHTAPPDLTNAPGFLQRAMVSSTVLQGIPPTGYTQPSPSTLGSSTRRIVQSGFTPMATPSPTAAAASFHQWVASGVGPVTIGGATIPGRAPASLAPGGPVGATTYTMSPTSARAVQLQSPTGQSMSTYSQPVQYKVVPATADMKLQEEADDDEGDGDDSDDGDVVAPHLRNLEDAPKPPPGAEHPSMGSEAHNTGTCKRCCFFPRGRCTNGYNCEFCHYEHEKRKRKNKKKKKKDSTVTTTTVGGMVMMGAPTTTTMMGGTMMSGGLIMAPTMDTRYVMTAPAMQAPMMQAPMQTQAPMLAPSPEERPLSPPQPTYGAYQPALEGRPQAPLLMPGGYAQAPLPQQPAQILQPQPQISQPQISQPQIPQPHIPQPQISPQQISQPQILQPQPQQQPPQILQQQPWEPQPGHIIYGPTQVLPNAPSYPAQGMALPPQQPPSFQQAPLPPPAQPPDLQQNLAPPPILPPSMHQVVDFVPPPPMQSPKMRQVYTSAPMIAPGAPAPMVPPPMSSPKLPRSMMPPSYAPGA